VDVRPSPPVHAPSARGRRLNSDAALLLFLLLLGVLPYANTLANGFVYDDFPQLVDNPYVRNFRYLREIFSTTVWSFEGAQGVTNYYRPIMTFGYLLCYQIFGPLPFGFHLANIFLNAAVVCLLFWVSRRFLQDAFAAFLVAALFALHPVHTESVAWIAGITDVELTFFYLLTFGLFLALADTPGGRGAVAAQLAMAGSFILALLSKEQAFTLPLLATLYEYFYRVDRRETSARRKVSRYGPLWLLAVAYLLFRARFLGGLAPVLHRPGLGWHDVALSAVALVGQYLGKLLWPVRLCAFYVFHASTGVLEPRVLAGAVALLCCAAVVLLLRKHAPPASFAVLWLLLTLAPVLNARWMAGNVFAERYLYLPSVGFCWLAGWAGAQVWSSAARRPGFRRGAVGFALCGVALLCAARTFARNPDWRDDYTLYTRTLQCSPDAFLIRANLGKVYWDRGDLAAAEREWRQALELGPKNVVTLNNLGVLYTRKKRYPEAVEFLKRAIAQNPNFATAHISLGTAYAEMGEREQAEGEYRRAVALAPLSIEARNYLGKFLFDAGRQAEAEEQFRASVEIGPTSEAYDRLGDIYLRWGSADRAERAFARAAALDPFDSHAHFRLGALYAARGRAAEAVREYEAGLQTDPANAEALAALRQLKAQISSPAPHQR
jgi:tetratricopeptide (TPR) repeat protein